MCKRDSFGFSVSIVPKSTKQHFNTQFHLQARLSKRTKENRISEFPIVSYVQIFRWIFFSVPEIRLRRNCTFHSSPYTGTEQVLVHLLSSCRFPIVLNPLLAYVINILTTLVVSRDNGYVVGKTELFFHLWIGYSALPQLSWEWFTRVIWTIGGYSIYSAQVQIKHFPLCTCITRFITNMGK